MFSMFLLSVEFIKDSCKHSFADEKMQKFIQNSKNQKYDLVLIEDLWTDSFLIFGHLFNAPMAFICEFHFWVLNKPVWTHILFYFGFKAPYGVNEMFDIDMGLIPPISHVPSTILPYTEKMDFFERWYNAVFVIFTWTVNRLLHVPWHMEIIRQNFAHLEPLPSTTELRKNASVYFVNAHTSITYPRPSVWMNSHFQEKVQPIQLDSSIHSRCPAWFISGVRM